MIGNIDPLLGIALGLAGLTFATTALAIAAIVAVRLLRAIRNGQTTPHSPSTEIHLALAEIRTILRRAEARPFGRFTRTERDRISYLMATVTRLRRRQELEELYRK